MKNRLRILAAIMLLPMSVPTAAMAADAVDCLTPSPTTQAGKNPYDPIVIRELTPKEFSMAEALFKSLEGDWKGERVETICTSNSDPSNRDVNTYMLKARITMDYHGCFKIQADLYSDRKKTTHQDTLRLYLKDKKLRLNTDSGVGDIELIELAPGIIRFRQNRLNAMQGGASIRQELFYDIRVAADKTLTMETDIYFQAKYYSRTTSTLQRD